MIILVDIVIIIMITIMIIVIIMMIIIIVIIIIVTIGVIIIIIIIVMIIIMILFLSFSPLSFLIKILFCFFIILLQIAFDYDEISQYNKEGYELNCCYINSDGIVEEEQEQKWNFFILTLFEEIQKVRRNPDFLVKIISSSSNFYLHILY